jgi:predicted O-methyltransferase YrrM
MPANRICSPDWDLPEFPAIEPGYRLGRSVHDGYQRGWGLQYGHLREQIRGDRLYQEAMLLARGRSIVSEDNRMNLYVILRVFLPRLAPGHIIEFGAYRGGNALFMAYVASRVLPGVRVYALDTFCGMPTPDRAVDAHSAGDFADVDLAELRAFARTEHVGNVEFVPGLFQDTAPALLPGIGRLALAHIDCDIASAVAYAYEAVQGAMVPGGYLVFDDAATSSCLGATETVERLLIRRDGLHCEQIFPHFVFRAPLAPPALPGGPEAGPPARRTP